MKKLFFVFVIMFFACSTAILAQAQNFTVVNKTGLAIDQLYISTTETNNWEEDVLGVDVLQNDAETDITFDASEESCIWDLKIIDEEGDAVEWYKLDLCNALVVTLYWENGKAWANIDEVE